MPECVLMECSLWRCQAHSLKGWPTVVWSPLHPRMCARAQGTHTQSGQMQALIRSSPHCCTFPPRSQNRFSKRHGGLPRLIWGPSIRYTPRGVSGSSSSSGFRSARHQEDALLCCVCILLSIAHTHASTRRGTLDLSRP